MRPTFAYCNGKEAGLSTFYMRTGIYLPIRRTSITFGYLEILEII
jgi:hypothetical protein